MSEKTIIDTKIQNLAKSLLSGDKKAALTNITSRLNEPFEHEFEHLFWRGLERALIREENDALICQLLKGLKCTDAKKIYYDLKKKKSEILIRDHCQTNLSKFYLQNWVSLLEIYCELCLDKQ